MRLFRVGNIILILFWILDCSEIKVKMDYDSEVDFTRYKTYRWINKSKKQPRKKAMAAYTLLDKRVKSAVERELMTKGMQKLVSGKPDLLVNFQVSAKEKVDVTHYGYGYGRRGYWRAGGVDVHRYKEGTLILDFIDPEIKQLIWRGWATSVVGDPEKRNEMINKSIEKMLKKYPPQ